MELGIGVFAALSVVSIAAVPIVVLWGLPSLIRRAFDERLAHIHHRLFIAMVDGEVPAGKAKSLLKDIGRHRAELRRYTPANFWLMRATGLLKVAEQLPERAPRPVFALAEDPQLGAYARHAHDTVLAAVRYSSPSGWVAAPYYAVRSRLSGRGRDDGRGTSPDEASDMFDRAMKVERYAAG